MESPGTYQERVESPGWRNNERTMKEWRAYPLTSWLSHMERSGMPLHDAVNWDKLWKGRNYWKSRGRCQVWGLRGLCLKILCMLSDFTCLPLLFGGRKSWYIIIYYYYYFHHFAGQRPCLCKLVCTASIVSINFYIWKISFPVFV